MPSPYTINIANGEGTSPILNGSYNVTASVTGYDNATINPATATVVAGTNTYDFVIASTGTLTLHVSEDGTAGGTAVAGAPFVRCDSAGTAYGAPVSSNASGNAEFLNVPFAAADAPNIYYRQTGPSGDHDYDPALKTITMTTSTSTIEVMNAPAATRTIGLTDTNYAGLPIEGGSVTFTAQ